MNYAKQLGRVDFSKVDEIDAQALYTFAVLACRSKAGPCFCGSHTTPLDPVKGEIVYPGGQTFPPRPEPGQWVRVAWPTSPAHGRVVRYLRAGYVSEYPHECTGFVMLDGAEKEFGPCLEPCNVSDLQTRITELESALLEGLAVFRGGYQAKDRIATRAKMAAVLNGLPLPAEDESAPYHSKNSKPIRVTAKRCNCGHIVHPLGGCHVVECDCKKSEPVAKK